MKAIEEKYKIPDREISDGSALEDLYSTDSIPDPDLDDDDIPESFDDIEENDEIL
ncbi:RecA-like recombination protein [Klebsiella phage CPRSB]|nr:RecA-like recombination protein [Klebsiella phage CPRSB]